MPGHGGPGRPGTGQADPLDVAGRQAGVCPPNTQIWPPSAATAGYRTGTGSLATVRKWRPSAVASTDASYLEPSYPPSR